MKSKYDNDLKGQVIEKGIITKVVLVKKDLYYNNLIELYDDEQGVFFKTTINHEWADFVYKNRSNEEIDCALLLLESKKRKALKVREKISALVLSGRAVFLTLTFRDDVLQSTTPATRRRYVARFLKSVSGEYVANIDFSPDINREHYHAVITSRVDLNSWVYGFAFAEKMRCHKNDLVKVSKYITKLTNHALKIDATRLIYSRN